MSIYEPQSLSIPLIGKTISKIEVSEGEHELRFTLEDGPQVVWTTSGDCCSESWWADGFSLNALRGGRVEAVNVLDLPAPEDDRGRQESDVAYGLEIVTDRGKSQMVFRNSSNGYYGGDAERGPNDNPDSYWREITGNDWQA